MTWSSPPSSGCRASDRYERFISLSLNSSERVFNAPTNKSSEKLNFNFQVHNLRIWSLTTDKTALAAHLVIEHGLSAQNVLTEATRQIRAQYSLYEMTLQVEEFQPDMEDCHQCQEPTH